MHLFEFLTRSQQLRAIEERVKTLENDMIERERRRQQTRAAREASPVNKPRVLGRVQPDENEAEQERPTGTVGGLSLTAFRKRRPDGRMEHEA